MAGSQWFIENLSLNFWFGHQGYEYIDLGRFWQIYLFIGLLLWVVLLLRALLPAFKDKNLKSLLFVVVLATVSIGLLYAAGFMWGKKHQLKHYGILALVGGSSLG
ncbi:Nitric-oxide reductase (EC, quinol-dependent [uncultured Gammaproteobacteria bacterium]|nr:Nitric-oxide reductase (EC, quinol-dependent [uncultured Gammaproteobacteria bacterium]